MKLAFLSTTSLFPDTSIHQIEISIYEDRGSSGSSSGSSSVSSSTARWLPCALPSSSSWIFIRLLHMIQYLVLSKFTERIHILLTESLVASGVLRHAFSQVDVHQNPQFCSLSHSTCAHTFGRMQAWVLRSCCYLPSCPLWSWHHHVDEYGWKQGGIGGWQEERQLIPQPPQGSTDRKGNELINLVLLRFLSCDAQIQYIWAEHQPW